MKLKLIFLAGLILVIYPSVIFGAFKDTGWGTRPAGLGGAFTGLADDANGPLYNPAGIARLKSREGNFMYAKLYTGLDEVDLGLNYFSVVLPIVSREKLGSLGVSWSNFTALHLYREDTFNFTYADWLANYFPKLNQDIAVGLNLKYLRHSYTLNSRVENDSVFSGGNAKGAATLDLGALAIPKFKYLPGLSLGLAIKNITQPDVGLGSKDIVPAEWRLGGAYNFGDILPNHIKVKLEQLTTTVDLVYRQRDFNYHFGAETYFLNRAFGLRAGVNSREAAFGFGYTNNISRQLGLTFDYTFLWPFFIVDTNGTHRASLSVRF